MGFMSKIDLVCPGPSELMWVCGSLRLLFWFLWWKAYADCFNGLLWDVYLYLQVVATVWVILLLFLFRVLESCIYINCEEVSFGNMVLRVTNSTIICTSLEHGSRKQGDAGILWYGLDMWKWLWKLWIWYENGSRKQGDAGILWCGLDIWKWIWELWIWWYPGIP